MLLPGSQVEHHSAGAGRAGRGELDGALDAPGHLGAQDGPEPEARKEEVSRLCQQVRLFDVEVPEGLQGGLGQSPAQAGTAEIPRGRYRTQQGHTSVELQSRASHDPYARRVVERWFASPSRGGLTRWRRPSRPISCKKFLPDAGLNFIPHLPEDLEALLLAPLCPRGVLERPVEAVLRAGKTGQASLASSQTVTT